MSSGFSYLLTQKQIKDEILSLKKTDLFDFIKKMAHFIGMNNACAVTCGRFERAVRGKQVRAFLKKNNIGFYFGVGDGIYDLMSPLEYYIEEFLCQVWKSEEEYNYKFDGEVNRQFVVKKNAITCANRCLFSILFYDLAQMREDAKNFANNFLKKRSKL